MHFFFGPVEIEREKRKRKLSIFWFDYNLRPQEKTGIRTPPAAATDNASAQSGRCESVAWQRRAAAGYQQHEVSTSAKKHNLSLVHQIRLLKLFFSAGPCLQWTHCQETECAVICCFNRHHCNQMPCQQHNGELHRIARVRIQGTAWIRTRPELKDGYFNSLHDFEHFIPWSPATGTMWHIDLRCRRTWCNLHRQSSPPEIPKIACPHVHYTISWQKSSIYWQNLDGCQFDRTPVTESIQALRPTWMHFIF